MEKIFLTLLMLSLVMEFIPNQFKTTAFSNGITISRITCVNALAFNRHLYSFAFKWVGIIVVLGLSGITIIFGHISALNITGTLFCASLVAYILHLIFSFIHDFEHSYLYVIGKTGKSLMFSRVNPFSIAD